MISFFLYFLMILTDFYVEDVETEEYNSLIVKNRESAGDTLAYLVICTVLINVLKVICARIK